MTPQPETEKPVEAVNQDNPLLSLGVGLLWSAFYGFCIALFVGGLFYSMVSLLVNAFTPDVAWLVSSGNYMIEHLAIPTHDIFSWTLPDKPWVLYQWLFEVLIAYGYKILGEQSIIRLLIVSVVLLYAYLPMLLGRKHNMPILFPAMMGAFALLTVPVNMGLRPMFVTTIFLAVQFVLVQLVRSGSLSLKVASVGIAVVYLFWGNMHTGVSIGLLSLALMLFGDWLERRKLYSFDPVLPHLEGRPLELRPYLQLIVIGFVASLINPYGIQIYTYLADLSSQKYLNQQIAELQSPDFHRLPYQFFLVQVGIMVFLLRHAGRVFSAQACLHLVAFTIFTLFVQRFVVWACLFYVLLLPKALMHYYEQAKSGFPSLIKAVMGFDMYRPIVTVMVPFLLTLFLVFPGVVGGVFRPAGHGTCDYYMKSIFAYQKLKLPMDRLFHDAEMGSCMTLYTPQQKVFIDTRFDFYGQDFVKQYVAVVKVSANWQQILDKWQINTIMLTKSPLILLLSERPEYRKIYEDKWIVILRKQ